MLSGFVLAHGYGDRLQGELGAGRFMRLRLIRLYPLYLAGLVIGLALALFEALHGWGSARPAEVATAGLFGIAFLPTPPIFGWTGGQLYPFNGPSWTLFFELVANLAFALMAKRLGPRVFMLLLPVAGAFTIFAILRQAEGGPGWLWGHFDAGLARVIYGFFMGVLIYRLRARWRAPKTPAVLAVLAFAAIVAVPVTGMWRQGYDALAAIVLMPLLVAFAAGAEINGGAAKVCGWLGLISYGVYALHVPLLGVVDLVMSKLHLQPAFGFEKVLLVALLAAIAATLADRFYDRPVRRWLTRFG